MHENGREKQRADKIKEERNENLLWDLGICQKFCTDGRDLTAFKENPNGCPGVRAVRID